MPASPSTKSTAPRPARAASSESATALVTSPRSHNGPLMPAAPSLLGGRLRTAGRPTPPWASAVPGQRYDERRMLGSADPAQDHPVPEAESNEELVLKLRRAPSGCPSGTL